MAKITFKTRIEMVYNMDETPYGEAFKIPNIKTSHCDMNAFRTHSEFGSYANSVLFLQILSRHLKRLGLPAGQYVYIDKLPKNVTIKRTDFLSIVTIEV